MAAVKGEKRVRPKAKKGVILGGKQKPVTQEQVDTFVDAILLKGWTQTAAWRLVHPESTANDDSVRSLAATWAHREDVVRRMQEVRDALRQRHEQFLDRLVEYHIRDIDGTYEREGSLANCMEQVKSVAKIAGYEKKTLTVDAKVGAADEGTVEEKLAFLMAKKQKEGK